MMKSTSLREIAPQYEEVHISVPWGHIAGRWYGNRSQRPILALHGWLDNLGTFDKLIPLLPEYIGVLAIDIPGHGQSSPLPLGMRYYVYDYLLIIPRIMEAYKWKTVSIMGHSLGGVIGFIFAALCPHLVDMLISLDIITSEILGEKDLDITAHNIEKHLIEEERALCSSLLEPPSYTLKKLRQVLSDATHDSVPEEFSQHLLYRGVAKSQIYPEKFYFSRDGRVKFMTQMKFELGFALALARRLRGKPYLLIRGDASPFVNEDQFGEVLSVLRDNPLFECYDVPGLHHVHLTNAAECAKYITAFIRHHRRPTLNSWSLKEEQMQKTLNSKQSSQEQLRFRARTKSKL